MITKFARLEFELFTSSSIIDYETYFPDALGHNKTSQPFKDKRDQKTTSMLEDVYGLICRHSDGKVL